MYLSLSFLLGIFIFNQQSLLEINYLILATIFFLFILFYKKSSNIILIIISIGYIFSYIYAYNNTNYIDNKFYNKYITTTGTISSLVNSNNYRDSFIFITQKPFIAKIKVAIYGKNRPKLLPGEKWRFNIKLKKNNTARNTATFDYEKWLFLRGIDATAYVNLKKGYKFIARTNLAIINNWRQNIRNKIINAVEDLEYIGIINALVIGDKSLINNKTWQILNTTNTTHLSVISGLHIAIIAIIIFLLTKLIFSFKVIINRIPLINLSAYITILFAFIYATLAGFNIPVQRAFIMLCAAMIGIIFRHKYNKWQLYNLALFCVLLINPLSVLDIGFWLSFAIVAIIIYVIDNSKTTNSWFAKIKFSIYLQLIITITLAPLLLLFFHNIYLLSIIANLVAIPIFSILIVPLSLIGALFVILEINSLAQFILSLNNNILSYIFDLLSYLAKSDFNKIYYFIGDSLSFIAIIIIAIIVLLKISRLYLFAIIILITIVLQTKKVEHNLYILDVSQGLSVVFIDNNYSLLYDTGDKFLSGKSMGDTVVNPFLAAKNVSILDKIIISHTDKDHIGGLPAILKQHTAKELITPFKKTCKEDRSWYFGNYLFEIFSTDNKFSGNNNSCVLKISGKYSFLLTADIEKKAERYLIKKYGNRLKSDVLLVPHHGSKSSSTIEFLQQVKPKIAIVSSGYKNRFKHPALEVINRYKKLNIKLFSTNCSGEIKINLATLAINQYRIDNKKYYHRLCK